MLCAWVHEDRHLSDVGKKTNRWFESPVFYLSFHFEPLNIHKGVKSGQTESITPVLKEKLITLDNSECK